jgi:hypothetical protein
MNLRPSILNFRIYYKELEDSGQYYQWIDVYDFGWYETEILLRRLMRNRLK